MDGHELHRSHPKRNKVVDHGRMREARVGAAMRLMYVWMTGGEALQMGFVDDGIVQWRVWRTIVAPVEKRVVHHRFENMRGAVLNIGRVFVCQVVRIAGRVPVDVTFDRASIRIEQKLAGIAADPLLGIVWSVDSIAIALARAD